MLKCPRCGSEDIRKFESVSYTQTTDLEDYVLDQLHPNEWCYDVDRIWCSSCGMEFSGVDTLEEMNEKLKDVLTVPEIDQIIREGDNISAEIVDSLEKAQELSSKERGVIYTQVDSETSDEVVYSKGVHLVNRTGIYAVILQG